jgi:hypothetical protein
MWNKKTLFTGGSFKGAHVIHEDYKTINRPYLIQTGRFQDVSDTEIGGLDSLINYDYMGSSEFEWGALPHSLEQICLLWAEYVIFQMDEIKDGDGQCLWVLCRKVQIEELKDALKKLFSKDCPFDTKERTGMYDYVNLNALRVNFWWDVTGEGNPYNNASWMCCFGDNIRRLVIAVRKVWLKKELKKPLTPEKEFELRNPNLPLFGPKIPDPIVGPKTSKMLINDDYRGKLTITVGEKKTVVIKKSIIETLFDPLALRVKVLTKSGREKILSIYDGPSRERTALFNIFSEEAKYNKLERKIA